MYAAALGYGREAARAGSIRRAADSLEVSASVLNRQVISILAELGTKLFDRRHGVMRLTAAGEMLLQHVATTLHDFDCVRTRLLGEMMRLPRHT